MNVFPGAPARPSARPSPSPIHHHRACLPLPPSRRHRACSGSHARPACCHAACCWPERSSRSQSLAGRRPSLSFAWRNGFDNDGGRGGNNEINSLAAWRAEPAASEISTMYFCPPACTKTHPPTRSRSQPGAAHTAWMDARFAPHRHATSATPRVGHVSARRGAAWREHET